MTEYRRFAIYHALPPGALADFGAAWLGWDMVAGCAVAPPPGLDGLPCPLADLTTAPRRYGLHGTLKPPFALARGTDATGLAKAVKAVARGLAPVRLTGLQLSRIGGFLALTPVGDAAPLAALAAGLVAELDQFRAPLTAAELDGRRTAALTARQDSLLRRWGYPHVMDEFRFHITLTGRLATDLGDRTEAVLRPHLAPLLPAPFGVDDVALVGERADGFFELIQRYPLGG